MNVEQARFNMIEQQIRPWEVLDPAVLSLLSVVRREDFVPPAYRALAFVDTEIPLPEGQSMLSPKLEARLLQAAQLHKHENVLLVGAGSGHLAALLGHMAQGVSALEIRPALARMAAASLRRAGVANVEVIEADGSAGLPREAPFDAIVLAGSVPVLPQVLVAQLKPGGRLVAIVGEPPVMQAAVYTRGDAGAPARTVLFDTLAPALDGFAAPSRFRF